MSLLALALELELELELEGECGPPELRWEGGAGPNARARPGRPVRIPAAARAAARAAAAAAGPLLVLFRFAMWGRRRREGGSLVDEVGRWGGGEGVGHPRGSSPDRMGSVCSGRRRNEVEKMGTTPSNRGQNQNPNAAPLDGWGI